MALDPRIKEYVDWAVRGTTAGLFAATLATARWAINTEQRVHDLEAEVATANSKIAVLEAKDDGYQQLRTDIAVIKSQLDGQDKKYDHIESLLTDLSRVH
jgi:hypothetical protein